NNVSAMETFLGALVDEGVKRVIFSSSCATYGVPEAMPLVESHPQLPISPYGETKLVGERMLRWFDAPYGLKHVALRYFNASGADPDSEIGEVHDPETHLIPLVMGAALGTRGPITVFGTDYPTPDGTAVRDYIHVADLADAHVRALRYLEEGGDSVCLNVGTGQGHSVNEIIAAVERETGKEVPRVYGERREGDPPELYANPALIRETLGWTPKHSDLATIVGTAWRWELKRRETGL
ncbi:UDP-glucose 4-epimerase GalE, partial [bacterium]